MTNFEYWKDRILEITRSESSLALYQGEPAKCRDTKCIQCGFAPNGRETCVVHILKWLCAEHIDRPKLTKEERTFCELVKTGWIARDEYKYLYLYSDKPFKRNSSWKSDSKHYNLIDSIVFQVGFSFIKFEDKEAWSIEDLLKLEVEE